MKKIKEFINNPSDLRTSLPNLISKNVFKDETENYGEEKSFTQKVNENLLKYKEIKMVYRKTGVQPVYFVYLLAVCLFFIFIGYFENHLTILIATLYPMYISIKTLQNEASEKEDISQWLTYWVVYACFINVENLFGFLLQYIPFYFFVKVVFLLFLILPQYNGAAWIYDKILKNLFNRYENDIYDLGVKVAKSITVTKEEVKKQIDKKIN